MSLSKSFHIKSAIPMQVNPSPMYPESQEQENPGEKLVHCAFVLQLFNDGSKHSSISSKKHKISVVSLHEYTDLFNNNN